jgi:tetratricopeptide (TPR) repeat protein
MSYAHAASRRRPRRGRHLAIAVLALAAGACTTRRASLPLESPGEEAEASEGQAPTETPAIASQPRIEEEALPSDEPTDVTVATTESAGLSVDPPPLLETIDANTAPNVAAATHLVDTGRTQMTAGDYGAALEQFERAIAIDPANPYAYYYLAELHLMNHTYDQAIAFADRAATLSEARAPAWASRAYTLQGNAFEAAGRFADAREAYTRAIQAAPNNLAAQVGLARVGATVAPEP